MIHSPRHLLDDFRAGDEAAADELCGHALRIAMRTASAMLGDRDRAADIAQETAVHVLRGAGKLRTPNALEAWIHRIAVRTTLREAHRLRARRAMEVPLGQLPEALEPAVTALPHDTAERVELRRAVRSALQLVPEKQRMALVLRYVHDLSQEQIAAALGVRSGTAGALLSRGRDALRTSRRLDDFGARTTGSET